MALDWRAYVYAADALKRDWALALAAVQQSGTAMGYVPATRGETPDETGVAWARDRGKFIRSVGRRVGCL